MKNKKKKNGWILTLIRDIFFGGKEYNTVDADATPFPVAAIFSAIVATVLVLSLMFSFIEISGLSSDIANMKKEMVTLTAKEGKLHDDLNHKYPHAELEKLVTEMGFSPHAGQTIVLEEIAESEENKSE